MIYELDPKDYQKARPVIRGLEYNVAIDAIMDGTVPGRTWVDDAHTPRTVFVWNQTSDGDWYLEGDERNEAFNHDLNTVIHEIIYPKAKALPHVADFTLRYFPDTWEDKLDTVLRGTTPRRGMREFFAFKHLRVDWRPLLPKGFSVQPVDEALLRRTDLDNLEELVSWAIEDQSSSIDRFVRNNFGTCLLHGSDIVSWCFTDWASGARCDVGIKTDDRYRRQGYGTLVAAATVEQCLAHGFTFIGWHCWSDNPASAATARRVGFEKVLDQPVFHAWYNQFDNVLVHEWDHYKSGDYRGAAEWLTKAIAMIEAGEEEVSTSETISSYKGRQGLYAHTAFVYALTGKTDEALQACEMAIELGWSREGFDGMKRKDPFKALDTTPDGKTFLTHAERCFGA